MDRILVNKFSDCHHEHALMPQVGQTKIETTLKRKLEQFGQMSIRQAVGRLAKAEKDTSHQLLAAIMKK